MTRSQRHMRQTRGFTSTSTDNTPDFGLNNPGRYPTDIILTPATITAASALNTVVGTLTTTDPDAGAMTYFLTDDDAGKWELAPTNNQVRKKAAVLAGAHTIGVRVTDSTGLTFTKTLTITVT